MKLKKIISLYRPAKCTVLPGPFKTQKWSRLGATRRPDPSYPGIRVFFLLGANCMPGPSAFYMFCNQVFNSFKLALRFIAFYKLVLPSATQFQGLGYIALLDLVCYLRFQIVPSLY